MIKTALYFVLIFPFLLPKMEILEFYNYMVVWNVGIKCHTIFLELSISYRYN